MSETARAAASHAPLPAASEPSGRLLARAVGAGLAAGAAFGALWGGLIVLTDRELGFAGVVAGWVVALVLRRAGGGRGGRRLWTAAAGGSLLSLLLAKFFFISHAMIELTEAAPDRPPGFHLGYLDPRLLRFFATVLPHALALSDALWLILGLGAAWRVLNPPRRI